MTTAPHTTSAAEPEMLRLATLLQEGAWYKLTYGDMLAVGCELRRQHDLIGSLQSELEAVGAGGVQSLAAAAPVAPTQPETLHTFLNAAAGEGLILDGVDAADLYIELFPERYAGKSELFNSGMHEAAPKAEPADHEHLLGNLLARIHGDGGHYAAEHGLAKAAEDAELLVSKWRAAPLHQGEYLPLPTPDSYLFQHDETGETMFVDSQQVEWGFEANNPRLQRISGAFTESQMHAYVNAHRAAWEQEHNDLLTIAYLAGASAAKRYAARGATKASPDGWKWMTHPSRNDGLPIPVRVFAEDGVAYYQPFDEAGSDFEWESRDNDWREIATPPAPSAQDADPLQGAANWLVNSHASANATELGRRLCIGYNRAERLFDAARAQQKGGEPA